MKLKEMFFKIIFSKIQFYPPSKKKILIYDAVGIEYFDKFFFKKDYEIFHNRYEKINFFILSKFFIKNKLSNIKKNYKFSYISYVSPKVIITFVDNNPGFYLIKEKFPEIIFIAIQNGVRTNPDFLSLKNKVKKNNKVVDYIFTLSKSFINKYKKIFNCEVINIGSFKLNFFSKKKINIKKDILFISQTNKNLSLRKIVLNEVIIIKSLLNYCNENKLKLDILLKGKKNILGQFKKEFNLKKNSHLNFITRNNAFENYNVIKNYKLIFFLNSTLGYEALALGKKIVSIPFGCKNKKWCKKNNIRYLEKFGYPKKFKDKGFFWSNKFDNKILYALLDRVIEVNNSKWKKIFKINKCSDIISYDYKNSILKKIIKKYIQIKFKSE